MPSADADLFALVARHRRYARRHRLAEEEASAANIRFEYPPAPAALRITADDRAPSKTFARSKVGAAKLSIAVPDVATFVDEFADITQVEFVFAAAALDAAALVGSAAAYGDVLASTRAALELVAP